jgi:hypothetical protein
VKVRWIDYQNLVFQKECGRTQNVDFSGVNMKRAKQEKNDFDLVVKNALDFFQKSLKEFDKKPKYSVIHFHAAVELIMKARLLWEHWTLIITRPETANLKSFRSGDFQDPARVDYTRWLDPSGVRVLFAPLRPPKPHGPFLSSG